MTVEEMSDLFDLLSNANQRQAGFGNSDPLVFDEYEKSVYLTMAQQIFVISCYNGKNESQYQFEVTEEDRRILDRLVKTDTPEVYQGQLKELGHIVPESVFYKIDDDMMFITYEGVKFSNDNDKCVNNSYAAVYPVTQDEFWKTYKNPFRGANNRRVLRLDAGDNIVELVSKNAINEYLVRYLRKPNPIILEDIPQDYNLTVFDGKSAQMGCELDDMIQPRIVQIAVNMALQRKSIGNSK